MGVPAFFRWLSRKYPQIIVNCQESKSDEENDEEEEVDATQPNPNGVEFDNLYLDMNDVFFCPFLLSIHFFPAGIIHPCCHPEGRPPPRDEDEMMIAIFEHIDRLFNIVRPRRLLYMAIDGVAPRAKMNQQRSRRFRAIKEQEDRRIAIDEVRADLESKVYFPSCVNVTCSLSQGIPVPPPKSKEQCFDSNCITPGTPFMSRLAECLRYYIAKRLNENPAWQNIQVQHGFEASGFFCTGHTIRR